MRAPLHAEGALSGGLENPALGLLNQVRLESPKGGLKDFEPLSVDRGTKKHSV